MVVPHKKLWFLGCLIFICSIGLLQLTTLSFDSLFQGEDKHTEVTTTRIPTGRNVQYEKGIEHGPRFTDSDGLPKVGPTKIKKSLDELRIEKDGTTVEGIEVRGPIYVDADNVTIRDFKAMAVIQNPENSGMVLEDGTIDGKNTDIDGIRWNKFTARRIEIKNTVDGIKAHGHVLLEDVWVHDLATFVEGGKDVHNDCVQISAGSDITIRYSRFERCGNNAAIFIKSDQGQIKDVTVNNNVLASGNYTFQALSSPQNKGVIPEDINVIDNLFISDAKFGPLHINVTVNFEHNVSDQGETISR